ncbi:MAG: Dabb family protein [Ruminococcus sp.]|nr:Dabb family protein [Ruminococcus sp.]
MIRHICMFKLKEEDREALIDEVMSRAQTLKEIPEIRRFEVVRNSPDAPQSNYDISLIFDLDSFEDLDRYQANEIHKAFGAFITEVRTARACLDCEI